MPLRTPQPEDEEDWVKASMEQNATLISSRLAADIARDRCSTAFCGHLPTVDLVAGRTFDDGDGRSDFLNGTTGTERFIATYGNSVLLSLNLPLFSGGTTNSRVTRKPVPLDRREGAPRAHLARAPNSRRAMPTSA